MLRGCKITNIFSIDKISLLISSLFLLKSFFHPPRKRPSQCPFSFLSPHLVMLDPFDCQNRLSTASFDWHIVENTVVAYISRMNRMSRMGSFAFLSRARAFAPGEASCREERPAAALISLPRPAFPLPPAHRRPKKSPMTIPQSAILSVSGRFPSAQEPSKGHFPPTFSPLQRAELGRS